MKLFTWFVASALVAAVAPVGRAQEAGFKIVNNPGGGQYTYGGMTGRGTTSDSIIYMLKQVHSNFGDKPAVGKFFQSEGGRSVAAFFTVMAKSDGNKPMAGLLIVSVAADGSGSAAVLYDERSRFGTSEPQMMKSLSGVWAPLKAATQVSATHERVPSAPAVLTPATGGDQSAAISLPAGWKITAVSGGQLTAGGPNGEMVFLGLIYQNLPPRSPDLFQDFIAANNQARVTHGLPSGTYEVISKQNLPGNAIQVIFKVEFNDGIGPRKGSVRVGYLGPRAISVSGSNLPMRVADSENATLMAVIHSYQQNGQVIAQMHQADMNRIQADADRANAQSAAINARREANTAAYNSKMDEMDRSSKAFQDYVLDRSVVRDNENSERGTLSNSYADSLVRGNPDRFQIVPNQDLIKGRDY